MSPTPYLSPDFNRNNKSPPFDRCADTVIHAKRAEDTVIDSSYNMIGSAVSSPRLQGAPDPVNRDCFCSHKGVPH